MAYGLNASSCNPLIATLLQSYLLWIILYECKMSIIKKVQLPLPTCEHGEYFFKVFNKLKICFFYGNLWLNTSIENRCVYNVTLLECERLQNVYWWFDLASTGQMSDSVDIQEPFSVERHVRAIELKIPADIEGKLL